MAALLLVVVHGPGASLADEPAPRPQEPETADAPPQAADDPTGEADDPTGVVDVAPGADDAVAEEPGDPDPPPEKLRTVLGHDSDEQMPWSHQGWKPEDVIVRPPFELARFLTGPWFGVRQEIYDLGIDLRGEYVMEGLGNPTGGLNQGFTYVHNLGLQLLLNMEKLIGWPGATFRVRYSQRSGRSLSRKIGNDFNVQQHYGDQNSKLVNVQLLQSLWKDRVNLSLGRILYMPDDFQTSPIYCQFINNAFCGGPVAVFRNVPDGATIYPTSVWGARVRVRPSEHTYVMSAVYDGDPTLEGDNDNGVDWDFGDNGVFIAMEAGWIPERGLFGLPAIYKIGGWYHTGDFDDLVQDINGDNRLITGLPARERSGNGGYYFAFDQTIYQEEQGSPEGVIAFGAFNFGPEKDLNTLPFFYIAGFMWTGPIPGRPRDKLTIGATGGLRRERLRDAQREADELVQRVESIVELNYQIEITRFIYLRPDVQYIFEPNGLSEIDDAFVIGFELGIRF